MLDGFGYLPVALDVYLDSHNGPAWQVSALRGRSGWLSVAEVSLDTPFETLTDTVIASCFDGGQVLSQSVTRHLLAMGFSFPSEAPEMPPDELGEHIDMMYWDFLGTCDLHHLRLLDNKEQAAHAQISAEEQRAANVFALVESHIDNLRRQRRGVDVTADMRLQIGSRISLLEDKQVAAAQWLHERIAVLRADTEDFETRILECLTLEGTIEPLYTIHWTARHHRDRTADYYLEEIIPSAPRLTTPDPAHIEQAELDARGAQRTHALKVKWAYDAWKQKDKEQRAKDREIDAFVSKPAAPSPTQNLPTDIAEVNALFRKIRERQRTRHKAEEEERRERKTGSRSGHADAFDHEPEEEFANDDPTPEDLWEQGEIGWRMKRRLEREQGPATPKTIPPRREPQTETQTPKPSADALPPDVDALIDDEIRKLIEGL